MHDDTFKRHIVRLSEAGYQKEEICKNYKISEEDFDKWVKQWEEKRSFTDELTLSELEREVKSLREELESLKREIREKK